MEDDIIIKVKQGKIRGIESRSAYSKHTFYSFRGIPYAKPPVDELRFRVSARYDYNFKKIRHRYSAPLTCITCN